MNAPAPEPAPSELATSPRPSAAPAPTLRPRSFQDRLGAAARLGEIGRPSWVGVLTVRLVGPLVRLAYRPSAVGLENLPAGPCLVVLNHSGGGIVDVASLIVLWHERFGVERRATGLAHPLPFFVPGMAFFLRAFGAVPSTREHAKAAFALGSCVFVFPGGDHEGFRPIWQAWQVDWNGREGFARLAREAWVPIVPVGFQGTHFTGPILWRSSLLPWLLVAPRLLGLKRMPLTVAWAVGVVLIALFFAPTHGWAATLGVSYLWTICPIAWQLPWVPWSVRMNVGKALSPEELFGSRESTAPVTESAERVRVAVEKLVAGRA